MNFKWNWYLICLLAISVISHHYVFTDWGILNDGDWVYYYTESAKDIALYNLYLKPIGFGSIAALSSNLIFYYIASLMMQLGLNWDIFTRVIFLIPIIVFTPLFSFKLFKKLFESNELAFAASLIYCFNPFFLKLQLDWITYANIWWIFLAMILCTINYLKDGKLFYLYYLTLLTFIGIVFEIRIMAIVLGALGLYLLIEIMNITLHSSNILKQKLLKAVLMGISILVGVLLHFFWILPLLKANLFSDVLSNASPDLFPSFYNILDNLTVRSYQWTGGEVYEPFIYQSIDLHLFLIPFILIVGLSASLLQTKYRKSIFIWICFMGVFTMLLGKQGNLPFTKMYEWLFTNVPFFTIFRESSKFMILNAFFAATFGAIGLRSLTEFFTQRNRKILSNIIYISICFLIIVNTTYFITQRIGYMTKGNDINFDDLKLKNILLNDKEFGRIYYHPTKTRFDFISATHPYVTKNDLKNISDETIDFKNNSESIDKIFDLTSIKYIIVPPVEIETVKNNPDNSFAAEKYFRYYDSHDSIVSELQSQQHWKQFPIDTNHYIYNNPDSYPEISLVDRIPTVNDAPKYKNLNFTVKDNVTYEILKPKDQNIYKYLYFTSNYHSGWKLVNGTYTTIEIIRGDYMNDQQIESQSTDLNMTIFDLSVINSAQQSDNLTLFFEPIRYYYIGLIISVTIFIIYTLTLGTIAIFKRFKYRIIEKF